MRRTLKAMPTALLLSLLVSPAARAGERPAAPARTGAAPAAPATSASPPAIEEKVGAATVDFSMGTVRVEAAAAADLHAPNAAVARVRAERAARGQAARRLGAALSLVSPSRLGCASRPSQAALDTAARRAPVDRIEYASDGSVALVLRVALADLVAPAAAATRGPGPDGGAPGVAVLLVDPGARPTWFREVAGSCAAAPRHFRRVSHARSAGGELAGARLVQSREAVVQPQPAAGPAAPLPRVVGIAESDDTGAPGSAAPPGPARTPATTTGDSR